MSQVVISVSGKSASNTRLNIQARQFNFVADEPDGFGGTDQGPNPLEYLLGGYAACLNVVAHVVAREQHINIERLQINISGVLDPSKFLGLPTNQRVGLSSIDVEFDVDSDASPAQLEKWIAQVKQRCPAGDNLANGTLLSLAVKVPVAN